MHLMVLCERTGPFRCRTSMQIFLLHLRAICAARAVSMSVGRLYGLAHHCLCSERIAIEAVDAASAKSASVRPEEGC